jgi:hypothetical protein
MNATRLLREAGKHLSLSEQLGILTQMAAALQYLESKKMVVYTVRLQHFLLGKNNCIKLAHFKHMQILSQETDLKSLISKGLLDPKASSLNDTLGLIFA